MSAFRTADIVLASALIVSRFPIENIEVFGKKGVFYFVPDDQEEFNKFLSNYDLGRIEVEPNQFNQQIKRLSSIVHRMVRGDVDGNTI